MQDRILKIRVLASLGLLRQNFPSKGKLGEFSNFEGKFSLEISFPFPSKWPVFPWNEGVEKMEFLWLEAKFMTFPREGKFTSSHFFASKDVMGCFETRSACYRGPKPHKCPKWLGEGAKVVLTSWSDGLLRVFRTSATLFCTSATLSCTSATGFSSTCTKTPFAPSPNHFGHF